MAADAPSKTRWEAENTIRLTMKINKNQNPELFALLQQANSKSGLARDLMQRAIRKNKNQTEV